MHFWLASNRADEDEAERVGYPSIVMRQTVTVCHIAGLVSGQKFLKVIQTDLERSNGYLHEQSGVQWSP